MSQVEDRRKRLNLDWQFGQSLDDLTSAAAARRWDGEKNSIYA